VLFIIWHIAEAFISPPSNLPDIYTVLNVLLSCGLFSLLFVYYVYRQFTFVKSSNSTDKKTQ
jgi:alpha-1,3-glucosyltransferase